MITKIRLFKMRVVAIVATLLFIHAILVAYAATCHSPTYNEPAHLVAGAYNWKFTRFDLYRVNPPLARCIASIPVLLSDCDFDWSRYYDSVVSRPEFAVGSDFIAANGKRSEWLLVISRWACIPLSLIGAAVAFRWARELYGSVCSGFIALALWCFSPNMMAYAELITSDVAASTFGLLATYALWKWLKHPTVFYCIAAGVCLGIAQVSKMSWVILFGLWPLIWLVWVLATPSLRNDWRKWLQLGWQLCSILVLAVYLLNLFYLFDGSFTKLKEYEFVSAALAGEENAGAGGNRFRGSILAEIPVPLPEQYLSGIDVQRRDFESYSEPSFLLGQWKFGGWWYYYLYALTVKVPHGTQLLVFGSLLSLLALPIRCPSTKSEFVLLFPGIALFCLVSSQTEFNHHFRYVLPCLPFAYVFAGRVGAFIGNKHSWSPCRSKWVVAFVCASVLMTFLGSASAYPDEHAYFNELSQITSTGTPLLHSSIEWGQTLKGLAVGMRGRHTDVIVAIERPAPYDLRKLYSHLSFWDPSNDSTERLVNPHTVIAVSRTFESWLYSGSSYLSRQELRLREALETKQERIHVTTGFTIYSCR